MEKDLSRKLTKLFKKHKINSQRVEAKSPKGLPDLYFETNQGYKFIELKFCRKYKSKIGLSSGQMIWFLKNKNHSFILLEIEGSGYFLFNGYSADTIYKGFSSFKELKETSINSSIDLETLIKRYLSTY